MYNDPELNGRYLGTISKDFVRVADYIKETSYQIRSRGLSKHPIFVISKVVTSLGQILIDKNEVGTDWNYAASFIGEFVDRKLIAAEMEKEFIHMYKDPDEFCCMFVVDEEFTNFLFIPYPED